MLQKNNPVNNTKQYPVKMLLTKRLSYRLAFKLNLMSGVSISQKIKNELQPMICIDFFFVKLFAGST